MHRLSSSAAAARRRVAAGVLATGLLVGVAACRSEPELSKPSASSSPSLVGEAEPQPAAAPPAEPTPATPAPTTAPAPPPPPPASSGRDTGPPPPPTPAALGAELARVEGALRNPATPAADLPALGLAQQVAYRQLSYNPGWRPEVLAIVPKTLAATVVANTDAEVRLASMHVKRPTTFPKWRIVAPPPPAEVLAAHQAAAAEIGVPWTVLASIHLVETRMGRIRGVSTAGAQGPMQFLPGTWAQYGAGGDIENLRDASTAAGRLLKRNGINGNPRAAVFSYNRSNAYVDAVLAYADVMNTEPRAFLGYHGWQVFYRHAEGDTLLPEGWSNLAP